ncbi:MAG: ParA family protein [Okeania sp. SIO3C4]|nr:ParA family protein [Okeania sp. SIO3C4]
MIIAIANQKGGVAKTTSAIALAGLLAEESTCLAIDLDAQGNLTTGLGIELDSGQPTACDVMLGDVPFLKAIAPTPWKVDVLPGDFSLTRAEEELLKQDAPERLHRLKHALAPHLEQYEYVVIDCPPRLGLLTLNAFATADWLLIPVQCQFFALKGLQNMVKTIDTVQQRLNPKLRVLGVLPTMAEMNTTLTQDIMKQLRSQFDELHIFDPVPKSVRFPESSMAGKPIHQHTREWRLVQPYYDVVRQITLLES